ncbi:diguanylate cyclase [Magnetospirillum sp. UT-4]|uniref:diguanylate cyclase n=1 Tax=Magnetospirillum sp. UT-4 TaxID=2681467 RepID=UPI001383FEED|nr:diguanylate cyclase [Magnetospirillum sp. UT-4]CAA7627212.1 hypothetical protein MTBUT4_90138 [Magnetospirillum sp. UT-4]
MAAPQGAVRLWISARPPQAPRTTSGNRACLNQHLAEEWTRFQRHDRPFSLILLDLDHFKQINDRLGHPVSTLPIRPFIRPRAPVGIAHGPRPNPDPAGAGAQ